MHMVFHRQKTSHPDKGWDISFAFEGKRLPCFPAHSASVRSCHEKLHADKIAAYICDGIGGGGGHTKKAGGKILRLKMQEKYGEKGVFEVVEMLLCRYIDDHQIFRWNHAEGGMDSEIQKGMANEMGKWT
jgi:hypothetical protein